MVTAEKYKRSTGCETKERILEVSLDLFSEKGFKATSIREIARAVGVRESAIYNHFNSKDEILESLFQTYGPAPFYQKVESFDWVNDSQEPREYLNFIKDELLVIFADCNEQKFCKIMMMEQFTTEFIRDIYRKQVFETGITLMTGFFQKMMDHKLIKPVDAGLLACEFMIPLMHLRLQSLVHTCDGLGMEKIMELANRHVEFFWQAVKLEEVTK